MLVKFSIIWCRIILQITVWKIRRRWTKRISRQIERMAAEAANPNYECQDWWLPMTIWIRLNQSEKMKALSESPRHPHKRRNQRTALGIWKQPLSPYLSTITKELLSPTYTLIHGGLFHTRKKEIIKALSFFLLIPSFCFLSWDIKKFHQTSLFLLYLLLLSNFHTKLLK